MKNRLKTTSFWFGISSAIIVLLDSLSKVFGLSISSSLVEDIIFSVLSILILIGFVTKKSVGEKETSSQELLEEIQEKRDKENKN